MEIEAKPKITKEHVRGPMQYVISAVNVGKITDDERDKFMNAAETGMLEMLQILAETAFKKGREYERRNGASHD
jgi:hypothetical protein